MGQCLAVGPHLKSWRCSNNAGKAWFCHKHKRFPIKVLGGVVSALLLGLAGDLISSYLSPPSPEETKTLQVTQDTQRDVATIRRLLENSTNKPSPQLNAFIESRHLEEKYPLGFALFYSDGRKTIHHGRPADKVQFDPSDVKLTRFTATHACISMRINNNTFNNECIQRRENSRWLFMTFNYVAFWGETLANSDEGVVWVLGLAPN
jgi:hypothetical protein